MNTRRSCQFGFLLIETLVAIGLLTVSGGICIQLVRTSIHTTEQSVTQQESIARQASALTQLQSDVSAGERFVSQGPADLSIDDHIRWTGDANGMHRSAGVEHRDWANVQLTLSIDDGGVLVRPAQQPSAIPARLLSVRHWLRDVK